MINKLKHKFVFLTTVSVAIMLITILLVVNIINYIFMEKNIDNSMNAVVEFCNEMPPIELGRNNDNQNLAFYKDYSLSMQDDIYSQNGRPNLSQEIVFFIIYIEGDEIASINFGNSMLISSTKAQEFVEKVFALGKTNSTIDGYRFQMTTSFTGQQAIAFLDISKELSMRANFLIASIVVGFFALLLTFIISSLLSSFAVQPIAEALSKQKKFITNASHEIKTPLTIISANMDILEMSHDQNAEIKNTKEQVSKLAELTQSLVALSRMDEVEVLERTESDIYELAEMAVESFSSVAKSQNKQFIVNIKKQLNVVVNEQNIGQLFYILLDNAFKYSCENSVVEFVAEKKQNRLKIKVTNSVSVKHEEDLSQIFDWFYRGDKSRNSQNSGFGVGLALAKCIVEAHKGKISAKYVEEKFVIEIYI